MKKFVYRQVSNIRRTFVGNENCRLLRCSWSIACRRCSNYIFILDSTHRLIGLTEDNCTTRRETSKFGDLMRLILEILRYIYYVRMAYDGRNLHMLYIQSLAIRMHAIILVLQNYAGLSMNVSFYTFTHIVRINFPLKMRGIHQWPTDSLHKGTVIRKAFLCHEIIISMPFLSYHVLFIMGGVSGVCMYCEWWMAKWIYGWMDWKVDQWMDLWMYMRMDGWVTSRLKTKLTMAGLYGFQRISSLIGLTRDHFEHAPSQLETRLHCNVISHWLGAYTKWSLFNRKLNEQNQVLFHRRCCTKYKNWMKRKYGVHSCTFLNHFMLVDSFICRQTLSWY